MELGEDWVMVVQPRTGIAETGALLSRPFPEQRAREGRRKEGAKNLL